MNRLVAVVVLSLLIAILFIGAEARRFGRGKDPCPRAERNLNVRCGRHTSGQCPGSSYCLHSRARPIATCCCNDTAATCPDCTQPVNCVIDPCEVNSCPAFPNATCRADFCGGCNARFFIQRQEVTDRCNEIAPCSRYGGRDIGIDCGRGTTGECPGGSYCDIHPTDAFATCCCNDTAATCPDCTQPMNCVIDPCEVTSCPAFPNAVCRADFCGGCNARFFIQQQEVTDHCSEIAPCSRYGGRDIGIDCGRGTTGECPGDSYCDIHPADAFATCCCNNTAAFCPNCILPVNCLVDPCQFASCPAFPDAKCRADFCGGCNARFFFHRQEVTKRCNKQR